MIYNNKIKEYGYELLDDVLITRSPIKFNCKDELGYKYFIPYDRLKANKKPLQFHASNPYVIYNISNWLKINKLTISIVSDTYIKNDIDMKWKCNIHNIEFDKKWVEVQQGICCPKCSSESLINHLTLNQDDVINDFKRIHGERYDYSEVKYVSAKTKIKVICRIHGPFMVTPDKHRRSDCYFCALDKTGWTKTKWVKAGKTSYEFDSYKVYFLKCWNEFELFYKIGRTFKSVKQRFSGISHMPYQYKILKVIEDKDSGYIYDLENDLLKIHHQNNLKYIPQIDFGGMNECFKELLPIA